MFVPIVTIASGAALAWLLDTPAAKQAAQNIVSGVPSSLIRTLVPASGTTKPISIPSDAHHITVYDTRSDTPVSVFSKLANIVLWTANDKPVASIRGSDLLMFEGRITVPISVAKLTISNASPALPGMYVTLILER